MNDYDIEYSTENGMRIISIFSTVNGVEFLLSQHVFNTDTGKISAYFPEIEELDMAEHFEENLDVETLKFCLSIADIEQQGIAFLFGQPLVG